MNEQNNGGNARVLELLSQTYPNASVASTEIINLQAILNLPKGTEHFMADIHGEYEAFLHIMKNGSGRIKRKVTELFGFSLSETQIRELCTLIYYPEQKLEMVKASEDAMEEFYRVNLYRLILVLQVTCSKYTRSHVRKFLPAEFAYIIEELLHESPSDDNKQAYFSGIIDSIMETDQSDAFITSICNVIQQLSVDQMHILGDIFDRGPGAHIIMDKLCETPNFDIQWGNHDALWMGAAAGNNCCIANVLRLSLRYNNMATLEDGYGINLVPLATFAMETYADDPCELFGPVEGLDEAGRQRDQKTHRILAQMHKAISVIQFKLEAQLIDKHPEWHLEHRKVLSHIDKELGVCHIEGEEYEMRDSFLPTVDPRHPNELTPEEQDIIEKLNHSFVVSDKLQRHIKCLLSHGCIYGVYNSNLLFHASIPLNEDGTLREVSLLGKAYKGKELLHRIGMLMRSAFNSDTPREQRHQARDYFWYLWCGPDSPLFDKDKMTTFERYFLLDPKTYEEKKGNYYLLRSDPKVCDYILDAFEVTGEHRHIINGHVPVHASRGENPIKADGKLMVIDGGFAKAYHHTTGIAGYTLVYHSRGFELIQHEPFTSTSEAIRKGTDIASSTQIVEMAGKRLRISDTDKGRKIKGQIDELRQLLHAYRHGIIKEVSKK